MFQDLHCHKLFEIAAAWSLQWFQTAAQTPRDIHPKTFKYNKNNKIKQNKKKQKKKRLQTYMPSGYLFCIVLQSRDLQACILILVVYSSICITTKIKKLFLRTSPPLLLLLIYPELINDLQKKDQIIIILKFSIYYKEGF